MTGRNHYFNKVPIDFSPKSPMLRPLPDPAVPVPLLENAPPEPIYDIEQLRRCKAASSELPARLERLVTFYKLGPEFVHAMRRSGAVLVGAAAVEMVCPMPHELDVIEILVEREGFESLKKFILTSTQFTPETTRPTFWHLFGDAATEAVVFKNNTDYKLYITVVGKGSVWGMIEKIPWTVLQNFASANLVVCGYPGLMKDHMGILYGPYPDAFDNFLSEYASLPFVTTKVGRPLSEGFLLSM